MADDVELSLTALVRSPPKTRPASDSSAAVKGPTQSGASTLRKLDSADADDFLDSAERARHEFITDILVNRNEDTSKPIMTAPGKKIVGNNSERQQTMMLRKKNESRAVEEAVLAAKAATERRLAVVAEREAELALKKAEVDDALARLQPFIAENDMKRERANDRYAAEKANAARLEEECLKAQADVRKLQESESTQRDEVKQLTRYGVFFEDVLQEASRRAEGFSDATELIARYHTLVASNNDLRHQKSESSSQLEKLRAEVINDSNRLRDLSLSMSSTVAAMHRRLEDLKLEIMDLEQAKSETDVRSARSKGSVGRTDLAVRNLYQRVIETCPPRSLIAADMPLYPEPESMLELKYQHTLSNAAVNGGSDNAAPCADGGSPAASGSGIAAFAMTFQQDAASDGGGGSISGRHVHFAVSDDGSIADGGTDSGSHDGGSAGGGTEQAGDDADEANASQGDSHGRHKKLTAVLRAREAASTRAKHKFEYLSSAVSLIGDRLSDLIAIKEEYGAWKWQQHLEAERKAAEHHAAAQQLAANRAARLGTGPDTGALHSTSAVNVSSTSSALPMGSITGSKSAATIPRPYADSPGSLSASAHQRSGKSPAAQTPSSNGRRSAPLLTPKTSGPAGASPAVAGSASSAIKARRSLFSPSTGAGENNVAAGGGRDSISPKAPLGGSPASQLQNACRATVQLQRPFASAAMFKSNTMPAQPPSAPQLTRGPSQRSQTAANANAHLSAAQVPAPGLARKLSNASSVFSSGTHRSGGAGSTAFHTFKRLGTGVENGGHGHVGLHNHGASLAASTFITPRTTAEHNANVNVGHPEGVYFTTVTLPPPPIPAAGTAPGMHVRLGLR